MTYKELQAIMKEYKKQGMTKININSKMGVLLVEYASIILVETTQQGIADKAVVTARANLDSVNRQLQRVGKNLISAYAKKDKEEIEGWGSDKKRLEAKKQKLESIIEAYNSNDLERFFELNI